MLKQKKILTEDEAKLCVEKCDVDFDRRLSELSEKVAKHGDIIKLIALSGPTCSGKTTAAAKLSETLSAYGRRVHIVSIDDFYIDRDILLARSKDGRIDFDSPDTIDMDALALTVKEIFDDSDDIVELPVYDFKLGKQSGIRTLHVDDSDVFIFEGIQAVYPNFIDLIKDYSTTSVFICAMDGIDLDGTVFEPNEIRLMRRIVRDYYKRGTDASKTFVLWESVRENEDKYIFPSASVAAYTISSTMPYEVGMLKPYLEQILGEMDENDKNSHKAKAILEKIKDVSPISNKWLSENSIYHEFLLV
jgi:uridine kinase